MDVLKEAYLKNQMLKIRRGAIIIIFRADFFFSVTSLWNIKVCGI